jgi:hypothetical protein
VRLRAIVRWHAARLDREFAAGISVHSSDAHARRAITITGRRRRACLEPGLARALRGASDSGARLTAAIPPDRRPVLGARPVIEALERRLLSPEPVAARGVAMLGELLAEPTSPLYRSQDRGALGSRLRAAAAALEPGTGWE